MVNVQSFDVHKSSTLSEIGYESQNSILFVKFKDGTTYKYEPVPLSVYTELQTTNNNKGSVGKYFSTNIRGKFKCTKI